jgi:hypothetical protein
MTIQELSKQIKHPVEDIRLAEKLTNQGEYCSVIRKRLKMTSDHYQKVLGWMISNKPIKMYIEPLNRPIYSGIGTYEYEFLSPSEQKIYHNIEHKFIKPRK